MQNFTIFGNPVEHSKSPQMHNAGFKLLELEANYSKTLIKDGNTIKDVFLNNNLKGANITVPHKEFAYKNADIVDEFAKQIGAVNTYINEDGKIKAYNTDAPGFYKAIEDFGQINNVIILGAGGTSKAIAVILRQNNINVTILNRSKNSKEFFQNINCDFFTHDEFDTQNIKCDLVINSTSAGLKDNNYPAPIQILREIYIKATFAFDCIYGKETPFLKLATIYNAKAKDGEDMLLYQGVLAFELFTNTKADNKLIEAMRQGLKGS
jgi:shikimate dehydrogenase